MAYEVVCYECMLHRKDLKKRQAELIQKTHRNVAGHIACFINEVEK